MAYSTLADIRSEISEDVLIELTDPTGTAVVDAQVASAIQRADAIIDGYLSKVAPVPLSPVTNTILELSVDLAIYTLYSRTEVVPDLRKDKYTAAIAFLESVADRKVSLGTPETVSGNGNALPIYSAPEGMFSTDVWRKY